jgi:hypothetical protein
MRFILSVIGIIFFLLGLVAAVKDATSLDGPWYTIGRLWFEINPTGLQVTEAFVSRYVDPCSIFVALGCSPFVWHPIIGTVLTWNAVPVFFILTVVFLLLGRLLGGPKRKYY